MSPTLQPFGNKTRFQLDELNDSYDKELKLALQQAEDYTVKYEEVSLVMHGPDSGRSAEDVPPVP